MNTLAERKKVSFCNFDNFLTIQAINQFYKIFLVSQLLYWLNTAVYKQMIAYLRGAAENTFAVLKLRQCHDDKQGICQLRMQQTLSHVVIHIATHMIIPQKCNSQKCCRCIINKSKN